MGEAAGEVPPITYGYMTIGGKSLRDPVGSMQILPLLSFCLGQIWSTSDHAILFSHPAFSAQASRMQQIATTMWTPQKRNPHSIGGRYFVDDSRPYANITRRQSTESFWKTGCAIDQSTCDSFGLARRKSAFGLFSLRLLQISICLVVHLGRLASRRSQVLAYIWLQ